MIDTRLLIWQVLLLIFIITYPVIRKIIGRSISYFEKNLLMNIVAILIISLVLHYLLFASILQNTDFVFIQILVVIYFLFSGFDKVEFKMESNTVPINSFKKEILDSLSKSFGGSSVVLEDNSYQFDLVSPYRLKYHIVARSDVKNHVFSITSNASSIRLLKIMLAIGYYISLQSIVQNKEYVNISFLQFDISSIFTILSVISAMTFLTIVEKQLLVNYASELPIIYKTLLQKKALGKLSPSTSKSKNLENVKNKAKNIVSQRDTNVIKAKKEKITGRIENVFGLNVEGSDLDPNTIKRVKLVHSVKRLINSTPPWTKVTIEQICEQSGGNVEEVEKVLSGLFDLKEIKGIYDVWNKEYIGPMLANWIATKSIMSEHPNDDIVSVKMNSDGAFELNVKKD